MIPLSVFLTISIIVSIFIHAKINNVLVASIASGLVSSAIYQIVGIAIIGYIDPFFIFAFIVGIAVAFVISLIVRAVLDFMHSRSADSDD